MRENIPILRVERLRKNLMATEIGKPGQTAKLRTLGSNDGLRVGHQMIGGGGRDAAPFHAAQHAQKLPL